MQISSMNFQAQIFDYQTNIKNNKNQAHDDKIGQFKSINIEFQKIELFSKDESLAQVKLFSFSINEYEFSPQDEFSLKDLGYTGKPIKQLTQEEASKLVDKDGFFGIEKTAQRGSDFVLKFAGDDLSLLKKGREGIVAGFKEAEKLWGGKLPDIAYETQKLTLEKIDEKINALEGKVLDVVA